MQKVLQPDSRKLLSPRHPGPAEAADGRQLEVLASRPRARWRRVPPGSFVVLAKSILDPESLKRKIFSSPAETCPGPNLDFLHISAPGELATPQLKTCEPLT